MWQCGAISLVIWQAVPFRRGEINALQKGHFKLIKFARSHGSIFWNDEFYYPHSYQQVEATFISLSIWDRQITWRCFIQNLREWLKTHFPELWWSILTQFLLLPYVETLRFLNGFGTMEWHIQWHPSTYTVAKKSFHDDIAEWAVKNGCPKDEYTSGICFSFSTVLIIITQNILSRFFLNYRKNYL